VKKDSFDDTLKLCKFCNAGIPAVDKYCNMCGKEFEW